MDHAPRLDFKDKTALVTGASRGIGRAAAEAMAALGARVYLVSRKLEDLQQVADSIEAAGGWAFPRACNTGRPEEIEDLFGSIAEDPAGLDVLVNNAATNPYSGPALEAPGWALEKTWDVNVRGYYEMCRHAAKIMAAGDGGAIVNVASIMGLVPEPQQLVYSMSKAAVIALTRGLAKELGPAGIRVNAIAPGLVETRFSAALIEDAEIRNLVLKITPLGRWAQPDEIIGAILYLASDLASFTTGSVLVSDGGVTA